MISILAQAAVPLLDQILKSARGSEKNVDSGTIRPYLRLLTHPAKDRDAGQAGDLGQRLEDRLDLPNQLTGRGQDQRTRYAGVLERDFEADSRATSGSRKAYVLPEPVPPRLGTSRPAIVSASVAAWMGVGTVMLRSARTRTKDAGRPRSVKETAGTGWNYSDQVAPGLSRALRRIPHKSLSEGGAEARLHR